MRQKCEHPKSTSERIVKNIRRATRKRHSPEEKIRIVLDGLRGEITSPSFVAVKALPEPLLLVVQGVPGGRQTASGGRYGAGRDQWRGQGPAARGAAAQGGRG